MADVYPPASQGPLVLPASGATQASTFDAVSAVDASGDETMYVNFVVFTMPAPGGLFTAPTVSLANIDPQTSHPTAPQAVSFDSPFTSISTAVDNDDGTASSVAAHLGPHPSGYDGVFQLIVSFNPSGYAGRFAMTGSKWKIVFTSTAPQPLGVTFVVDGSDSVTSWIDLPGITLYPLAGDQDQTIVPVSNFGTGPLTVDVPTDSIQGLFTLRKGSVTVGPGSMQLHGLTLAFTSPTAGTFTASFDVNGGPVDGDGHASILKATAIVGTPDPAFATQGQQFSPASGSIGSCLAIRGTNLSAANSLVFNAAIPITTELVPSPTPDVEKWALVPPGLPAGPVTLSLSTVAPVPIQSTDYPVMITSGAATPMRSRDTFAVLPAAPAPARPAISSAVTDSHHLPGALVLWASNGGTAANTAVVFTDASGSIVSSVFKYDEMRLIAAFPYDIDGLPNGPIRVKVLVDVVASADYDGTQIRDNPSGDELL